MVLFAAIVLFGIVAVIIATIKGRISIGVFACISIIVVLCFVSYTHSTILVVPPTKEVPKGRTLIIPRLNFFQHKTDFIDSVDAVCKRTHGNVGSFCQQVILTAVSENTKPYVRLPYSRLLHFASTIHWSFW